MIDVYVVDGPRTPQGRYGGAPAPVRPDDLAALVVGEAVARSGVPADAIDATSPAWRCCSPACRRRCGTRPQAGRKRMTRFPEKRTSR
ncbi:hypothetical protein Rruber_00811 [Rhodococcus ruber]